MEVYTGQPQDAPFDNIYQTKNYILFDLELSSRASLVVQSVKSLPAMGDLGLIPGSGRFSGEGNGNPPQYSCLESPMERGAWQATVHGVAKSRTQLSDFHFTLLPS